MAAVGARRLRRRFVTALAIVATFAPGLPAIGSVPAGGSQLWESRFTTPGRYWDEANSVATSSDGSKVFVTGSAKETRALGITPRWLMTPRPGRCCGGLATTG